MSVIDEFTEGNRFLDLLEAKGIKFPERVTRIVIDMKIDDICRIYYSCVSEDKEVDVFGQIIADEAIKLKEGKCILLEDDSHG